jgi:hypothetical protein
MKNNYIKCGRVTINNKTYQILIDSITHEKQFLEVIQTDDDKEKYIPVDDKILEYLKRIFVPKHDGIYFAKGKFKKTITSIVIAADIFAIVFVGFTLMKKNNFNGQVPTFQPPTTIVTEVKPKLNPPNIESTINFAKIVNANKKIQEQYKETINLFIERVGNLIPDSNVEQTMEKVANLTVEERNKSNDQIFMKYPNNAQGYFDGNKNLIVIKDDVSLFTESKNSKDIDKLKKGFFCHELFHAYSHYGSKQNTFNDYAIYLNEGMTQLLNNELMSEFGSNQVNLYPKETNFAQILIELVGSDVMAKAYLNGDIEVIYKGLENIKGTREDAIQLIASIENLCAYNDNIYKEPTVKVDQTFEQETINSILSYLEAKYEINIGNGKYTEENYGDMANKEDYFQKLLYDFGLNADVYIEQLTTVKEHLNEVFANYLSIDLNELKYRYYQDFLGPNEIDSWSIDRKKINFSAGGEYLEVRKTLIKMKETSNGVYKVAEEIELPDEYVYYNQGANQKEEEITQSIGK